jgi:1-acyl-sn-glycerol-3-phosphate acyltransferase
MKTTIFTTPIFSPLLRLVSNSMMNLAGWKVDGTPPNLSKYVIIGAPHTSNWDFILFLGVVFRLKIDPNYMGKVELFRSPIGWFFY